MALKHISKQATVHQYFSINFSFSMCQTHTSKFLTTNISQELLLSTTKIRNKNYDVLKSELTRIYIRYYN